jgi:hypothetical protein
MKRSENVGLMLMGGAVFAATFAGGMTYMSMQRPSHAQSCTPAQNGTQTCQPASRGFTYFFYPSYWTSSGSSAPRPQQAAFSGASRPPATTVSASGTERSGFGSSAKMSFRPSAGG